MSVTAATFAGGPVADRLAGSPAAGRLGRYVASRILGWVVGLFVACLALVFLVDAIEMLRRTGDLEDATAFDALSISALRLPWLGEQLMPFAVLLGAIVALLGLSRRLELVVARAAGMSVWGFLRLAALGVFLLGALATGVYNPVSAELKTRADAMEAKLFSAFRPASSSLWLRQEGRDGQSILRAAGVGEGGQRLIRPTFYVLDRDGHFVERVEAEVAELRRGYWRAREAWISSAAREPYQAATYVVTTSLTAEDVREALAEGLTSSFWTLPASIARARSAGLPAYDQRQDWHAMIARPLLLVGMLLIAASVSLGLARSGGVGQTVIGGIAAGFGFYIVDKLCADFGSAGLIFPALAAWVPPLVGTMLACWFLLKREDG